MYLDKFSVALQLFNENLMSTDKAMEIVNLSAEQFIYAVKEIRLGKKW